MYHIIAEKISQNKPFAKFFEKYENNFHNLQASAYYPHYIFQQF